MTLLFVLPLVWAPMQELPARARVIVRHDNDGAADGQELVEAWIAHGDELVYGERRVPLTRLAELRERILERRCLLEKLPQVPEAACLKAMGLDAEAFEAHREEWFLAALPPFWKIGGAASDLAAETTAVLTWERCAPEIALFACGRGLSSVHGQRLRVDLPGEPAIRIENASELPWLLPWLVQIGERREFSADVVISRSLLHFAPASGSFAELLDGEGYWKKEFWSDPHFWRNRVLGGSMGSVLDDILCQRTYEQLRGWGLADGFLRVDEAETGVVGFTTPSMELDLAWRSTSPIERVRWLNPKYGTELGHSWIDLLSAWQDANQAVVREAWIDDWKQEGSERSLTLALVGTTIEYDALFEETTLPAWRGAGFSGMPDWKLQFHRGSKGSATVFLSRDQPGALIESARPGEGPHWLDGQEFNFHPRSDVPTFGRVDAVGNFERKTLPKQR
jgi:hypothetical protein